MPTDPAALARLRVVYPLAEAAGMDPVEVRRDVVYRTIEGQPPTRMTMDIYLPGLAFTCAHTGADAGTGGGR